MTRPNRHYQIFNEVSGEVVGDGYSWRAARNALVWMWNTGGDTRGLIVRRDPTYVPDAALLSRMAELRAKRYGHVA